MAREEIDPVSKLTSASADYYKQTSVFTLPQLQQQYASQKQDDAIFGKHIVGRAPEIMFCFILHMRHAARLPTKVGS
jgi:hypothetical protein